MRVERVRHWVFPGSVPLGVRLRFAVSPSGTDLLPGSYLVWYRVCEGRRPAPRDRRFSLVEGVHRCPRDGELHAYVGLVYEGCAPAAGERVQHWPDSAVLGLLCETRGAEAGSGTGRIPDGPFPAGPGELALAWRRCRARRRDVLLYAGAGVSTGSGVPTSRSVRERLGAAPASAECVRRGLKDPSRLFDVMSDLIFSVDGGEARPGPCHRLVGELKRTGVLDWVLTTNGDRLLEDTGIEVVRVFDHGEVRSWAGALETGVADGSLSSRLASRIRGGDIGLFVSVGASRLAGRELGAGLERRLRETGADLFLINPERPVSAPDSRWIAASGESALAGLLESACGEQVMLGEFL